MRGQSGHLVNGTGPYYGHDWREAEVELDITRRRCASLPEKRKNKVGGRGKGKGRQWGVRWLRLMDGLGRGMLVWISCGSRTHVSKWWVPHSCG